MNQLIIKKRGRPRKNPLQFEAEFKSEDVKLVRGNDLYFSNDLFTPIKMNSKEINTILSTEGGLMPGTNMVLVGGPGSGKSTLALDWLSDATNNGYKCLFISAEMDEIAYYKYCRRIPKFNNVQVLFLKNYSEQIKQTLEYVFNLGYDIICVDSIAEVIEMYKDTYRTTESAAEFWFLNLQDKMKKGENLNKYYTSFINIQQVTKTGDFAGSNRLKHMTDGMAHIDRSKDGLERTMYFSKNRDCDKDFKVYFTFHNGAVHYTYEMVKE